MTAIPQHSISQQRNTQKERSRILTILIRRFILGRFFQIPLSALEAETASDAVDKKYTTAVSGAIIYSIFLIPSLLLLDTAIVVSVLIPTTMVAGTAWFSVSLASMKKKFENFGMELTADLFVAFTLSLIMLFLATAASLTKELWAKYLTVYTTNPWLQVVAAIFALIVVAKLIYSIFAGSLKYDINDAMLTGQNEAAERFFKKSLSLLHSTSESLRNSRSLQVANYSIGVAFYEVFSGIRGLSAPGIEEKVGELLTRSNSLIKNPSMPKDAADLLSRELAESFVVICRSTLPSVTKHKSFIALNDEIECLKQNTDEGQEMVDTRMSVIFAEISNLIEEFGQTLFDPNNE